VEDISEMKIEAPVVVGEGGRLMRVAHTQKQGITRTMKSLEIHSAHDKHG
jgi:hypothetical protein